MALLGVMIDSRTLASIAAQGTFSFAHGLPAAPDEVVLVPNASVASATASQGMAFAISSDATNVSITNYATANMGTSKITSKVFHSVMR
jgi:hypothetical protein